MSKYRDGSHQFSPTELATFRDCRRKWMMSYFLSLRRKERDVRYPMTVGNLVHGALEVFYLNGGIHGEDSQELAEQYLIDKRDEDLMECAPEDTDTITKAHKSAEACLHSYLHWVHESGVDLNLKILGTEDKLSKQMAHGVLNGRIDLLAEDTRNGDIVVLDFKLVGSIVDKIRQLHMDQQAKAYAVLARQRYGKPVRVAFRLVKINGRTSKVKGAQEEEYQIVLNESQLNVYEEQVNGMMFDIIELSDKLEGKHGEINHQALAYPSPSESCSWKCEWFAVCPMMDDPASDAVWVLNDIAEPKFDQTTGSHGTMDESASTTTKEVTQP